MFQLITITIIILVTYNCSCGCRYIIVIVDDIGVTAGIDMSYGVISISIAGYCIIYYLIAGLIGKFIIYGAESWHIYFTIIKYIQVISMTIGVGMGHIVYALVVMVVE